MSCNKCSKFGLIYSNPNIKSPVDFIEGNGDSKIWIIGLNPKTEVGKEFSPTYEELSSFSPNQHSYFLDFKKVSPKFYQNWESKNSNIAHTDLVKCGSPSFPPNNPNTNEKLKSKDTKEIISNCLEHLKSQILLYRPQLIICNGSFTSQAIFENFSPDDKSIKSCKDVGSYISSLDNHKIKIILTGFIGRIDDWSKRRLGIEIEESIRELGINIEC